MRKSINRKKVSCEIGSAIRKRRERLGLSQESFAEKADIHRTYVSDIELGKVDISISILLKLCKALKTTPSKIFKNIEKSI